MTERAQTRVNSAEIGETDGREPKTTRFPPASEIPDPAPSRDRAWPALVLVIVVGVVLIGLHVHVYRQLSVYDEPQHVDYVNHLAEGEIVVSGDRWTPETARSVACRTIDNPAAEYVPSCDDDYLLELFPNFGLTTAFIHTPAYYVGPLVAAEVADRMGIDADRVSVMRLTGALWYALSLFLLWLLWRDDSVRWQVRAALALGLTALPVILLTHSTVNNDATALAAGAALTLSVLRWDRGEFPAWVPVMLALVAMLLKSTNLAALLLICAFAVLRGFQRARREGRLRWRHILPGRTIVLLVGCAASAILVGVGWMALATARATLDQAVYPQNIMFAQDSFDIAWLWQSLPSMITPLRQDLYQSALQGTPVVVLATTANLLLLALSLVGALRARPGSALRALAVAAGLVLIAFPPVLVVGMYLSAGINAPIPARYGLSLVPALLLLAGGAVRSYRGGWILLVGSGVAVTGVAALLIIT